MRRFLSLLMTLCLPLTAFAGNIKDTNLITSNTLISGMGGMPVGNMSGMDMNAAWPWLEVACKVVSPVCNRLQKKRA